MEKSKKPFFFMTVCFGSDEIPGTTSKTVMGIPWMHCLTDVLGIVPMIVGLLLRGITQSGWLPVSPSSSIVRVCLMGAIIRIGCGSAQMLPRAMSTDVTDQDERETGKRREGAYSGVMAFLMKMADALAMFMVGLVGALFFPIKGERFKWIGQELGSRR